jgi:hypothetical protein
MTLALGLQCRDGIVLGADSQITGDASKWSEKKIIDFPKLRCHPYFAFATNDVDFAKGVVGRLADCIGNAERVNSEIVSGLKAELKKIHKEYCRLFPKKEERPTCDLLLALYEQHLSLYLIRGVECVAVPQAEYIGFGESVGRSIATPLFSASFSTQDAERLAVYVLMQAKEYVRDVGKGSDIVQIWENIDPFGPFRWWSSQEVVKEMEEDFAVFQKAVQPILTGCYFGILEEEERDDFQNRLRIFAKTIKAQRHKRIRRARQLRRNSDRIIDGLVREAGSF